MSAIERCRTAALGGHVECCEACAHLRISYNSCRNRHCPKCQAAAAQEGLAGRQAELLPVPHFHVVFTLPGPIADIAYQNKAVVYDRREERGRRRRSGRHRMEHLSLLRRAYGHHRDLQTRLRASALAHPITRARQLMTGTLRSPSHSAAPVPGRSLTGDGSPPPIATVSAAFDRHNADRSRQDHRSDPVHGDQNQRRADYSAAVPVRTRKTSASTGAKSPWTDTTAGANSPRGFLPRGFSDASSVHFLTPVSGRRPKTLNRTGRCRRLSRVPALGRNTILQSVALRAGRCRPPDFPRQDRSATPANQSLGSAARICASGRPNSRRTRLVPSTRATHL
jgi:hypothetical protein